MDNEKFSFTFFDWVWAGVGRYDLYLAGCGWAWVSMTFFDWVWVGLGECDLFLAGCG